MPLALALKYSVQVTSELVQNPRLGVGFLFSEESFLYAMFYGKNFHKCCDTAINNVFQVSRFGINFSE